MGTDKRARQKELHRSRLEAARDAEAKRARRNRLVRIGSTVALVVLVLVLVNVFTDDDTKVASKDDTTTTVPALTPATLTGPGPGDSIAGETPCPKADGSSPRTTGFTAAPPLCIRNGATYTATFETSKGNMTVALDPVKAPKTVNNFVVLARYHYFDGSPFFRLVKDFAAQFGDPSETPSNAADIGYTIDDELPEAGAYQVGSLVMANTGQPNSGGGQMFFVLGANGTQLPASYSLFGQVTEGIEVLEAINAVPSVNLKTAENPDGNDGAPTEQVTINKVTITET